VLAALTAVAATALASPAAATLLLTGRFIQLPIDDTEQIGRFMGTGNSQGAKYNPAGSGGATGRDFWVAGTPVYNYTIAVGGGTFRTNGLGWAVAPTLTDTSSGLTHSARIDGSPIPGLVFSRSVSFNDADEVIVIRDTLTNTGASQLTLVATLDNTDPDQSAVPFSNFQTSNDVVSASAPNDLVLATGIEDGLTVGMGSASPLRIVDVSGFENTNPYPIITLPQDPNGANGDTGINLIINYGTLDAGASQSATWSIVFGATKSAAMTNYLATLGVCGNGVVEPGEPCDEGPNNGAPKSCCTTTCTPVCDDGNLCTDDGCDSASGAFVCSHTDNTAPCASGSRCVVGGTCSGGVCGGGTPRVCDDHNPCTDDGCGSATGCFTNFNSAPCDDHNACTDNDRCSFGSCTGGTFNSTPCDDGNACSINDRCSFGFCQGGAPRDCNDHNPCTTEFCQFFVGCIFTNLDGIHCDDNNPCTTDDFCRVGRCSGDPRNCFDDDPCSVDSCSSAGGAFLCMHESCASVPDSTCPSMCQPPGCGNGRLDPGETCDPPDPTPMAGRPGDVTCRPDCGFCGDGVVQTAHSETCDDGNELSGCTPGRPNVPIDACQNNCTPPICKSPSKIRVRSPKSLFTMHGWITPVQPAVTIDPHANGFVVELTDPNGAVVFRSSLDRGLILPKGGAFRYADRTAKSNGGIARLRIREHQGEFVVALTAYGDLSGATDQMSLHVFIGPQEWTLSGRWVESSHGWTLDVPSTFQGS
jgi:hypothetical protein